MKLHDCIIMNNVDYFVSNAYCKYGDSRNQVPDMPWSVLKNQVGNLRPDRNELYPGLDEKKYFSFFYLYGQCDGWWDDEDLMTQNYYIDKFVDDKTYIFINFESESNLVRRELG